MTIAGTAAIHHHRAMLKMIVRYLLLLVAFLSAATATSTPPPGDPARTVRDFFDAYRSGDVDRMMRLMAADVAFEDPTFRLRANGREELRKVAASLQTSYRDITIDVHTMVVSGDRVATELTISAVVERKDGPTRRIKVRGASFFRIRDGFIATWTDYFDFQTFSEQVRSDG